MNTYIFLLDGFAVSIFGSVLSAAFCNVNNTPRNRLVFWCFALWLPLLQGAIYAFWGADFLQKVYPLAVHIPLILVLYTLSKDLMWSVVSVFCAYLCCQLRRWIALLIVALVSGGELVHNTVQLLMTIPLLLILLKFVAPAFRQLAHHPAKIRAQFCVIPAIYYVFDYLTTVYTDLLISGGYVVIEFMPFVCCAAYLVFLLYLSKQDQKRFQLQQAQKVLDAQLSQSVREITALRDSQALARQYRHDLRHHLQYLSTCIENGQTEQAQSYIAGICREIEAQKVQCYCENEAANLILSAFAARAQKCGVQMKVQAALPAAVAVSDSDLCVLLSNALENALNACQPLAAAGAVCTVDVQIFEREGRLFLQVRNPSREAVRFENGIPVSDRPDHGIGVQSICAIVERYGGVYSFAVQQEEFILRLSV